MADATGRATVGVSFRTIASSRPVDGIEAGDVEDGVAPYGTSTGTSEMPLIAAVASVAPPVAARVIVTLSPV